MFKKTVLISPAHYYVNLNSQSEFYFVAELIRRLASRDESIKYIVICGYCKNKNDYPANIEFVEVFKDNRQYINIWVRLKFYFLVTCETIKISRSVHIDVLWHLLPNGLSSFNPYLLLRLDKWFLEKPCLIVGRLQYTALNDLQDIDENKGKILYRKNKGVDKKVIYILLRLASLFARFYYSRFNVYIFNNRAASDYYKDKINLQLGGKRLSYIGVGVDTSKFKYRQKSLPSSSVNLLFVGNLTKNKNVDLAIKICNQLNRLGKSALLHIVGDGDERLALGQLAKQLGVSDKVIFYGAVPKSEISNFHINNHILLLLSSSESFGQVAIESWASGTLFVGSDIPALKDLVRDGHDGIIVSISEVKADYLAAKRILELDADKYKKITSNALNSLQPYKWDTVVERYYEEIVK